MAQKLYELALRIQGGVDGSLEGAMRQTQGHLKDLEQKVKDYQEQHKKVNGVEAAYARNSASAQALGATILDLKRKQADISGYESQRKATVDAAGAYRNAKGELKALTAAYAQDKTKENAKAMHAAKKNADALEKSYKKNKDSLTKMEGGLKKAGINTKDLSGEQKRLAGEISQATKKQEEFNAAAERTAKRAALWKDLQAGAAKYAHTAKQALKWTAGIGAALGYGGFRLAKSVAETGNAAAKLGKKVRMSAEDVQMLQSVAGLSGVKDLAGALITMTKNTDMAVKKRGKAVEAFKELKIDPKEFSKGGGTKDLIVISERLQEIKDVTQQERILQGLFGNQWAEMAEMLRQGPDAIKKAMEEAKERGILSNESSAQSEEFLDNLQRMQESLNGLKIIIGDELRPVVNEIVVSITDWIKNNKELIRGKIHEWMKVIKENLPQIRDNLRWVIEKIQSLLGIFADGIDKIGGFKTALTGFGMYVAGGSFLGMITQATKAFGGLKSAYDAVKGINPSTLPGAGGTLPGAGVPVPGAGTAMPGATPVASGAAPALPGVGMELFKGLGFAGTMVSIMKMAADKYDESIGPEITKARNEATIAHIQSADLFSMESSLGGGVTSAIENNESAKAAQEAAKAAETARKNRGDFNWWEKLTGADKEWKIQNPLPIETNVQNPDVSLENVPKLNVTVKVNAEAANEAIAQNARGGLISTPTISKLSERGPEMIVPLGEADRGFGLSRLAIAARKLGVSMDDNVSPIRKFPEFPKIKMPEFSRGGTEPRHEVAQNLTFSPNFNITGSNAEEISNTVMGKIQALLPQILQDAKEEAERTAYATA